MGEAGEAFGEEGGTGVNVGCVGGEAAEEVVA